MPTCVQSEALVLRHCHLVRDIAHSIRKSLPAYADFDDLIGAGMLGLVDAAQKFDPGRRTSFRTYAIYRIRGAMQDSLRAIDPLSRDMRKRQRESVDTIAKLAQAFKRYPTEEEIAPHLRLSVPRWRMLAQRLFDAGWPVNHDSHYLKPSVPVENLQSSRHSPEDLAVRHELRRLLDRGIRTLPPRYQTVIRLYYERAWTMQRIGSMLGVNESRVSQIHAAALERLRRHLTPILSLSRCEKAIE